jgi:hypothetical protein
MMRVINFIILISILLLGVACQSNVSLDELTGGASGTDLSACAIVGSVIDFEGHPIDNATIRLRPKNYRVSLNDSLSQNDLTAKNSKIDSKSGSLGYFRLENVDTGNFLLEIVNDSSGWILPVSIKPLDSLISLMNCKLEKISTVVGNVDSPEDSAISKNEILIELIGLEYSTRPDTSGSFSFTIPGGSHRLILSDEINVRRSYELSIKSAPLERTDLGTFTFERDSISHDERPSFGKKPRPQNDLIDSGPQLPQLQNKIVIANDRKDYTSVIK